MGSSDSSCCGPNNGSNNPDPFNVTNINTKRQTSKETDALLNGDTYTTNGEQKQYDKSIINNEQTLCITKNDITKCESLSRCIKIIIKYNQWLEDNNLLNKRKLFHLDIDYNKYNTSINELISVTEQELFVSDSKHIKHFHHYSFKQIREYIINNTTVKKHNTCNNDNCFSMKYFYLGSESRNKSNNNNILLKLTNLHVFLYHSMYISELNISDVHSRDIYLIINYTEQIYRKLNIIVYENDEENTNDIFIKLIHLISFYYGGKFIEDDDTLDTISPLGLAQFIEQTMNKATLNQVWSKLDQDGSDTIDADEVDDILLLTVILSIATAHKNSDETKAPQIDKTELKHLMTPIGKWIKEDKMLEQPVITKDEFRDTFSKWLKEYHKTNGGIIADEIMENNVLIKYKINKNENEHEKNGNIIFKRSKGLYNSDRLVINCEYLMEHHKEKENIQTEEMGLSD